MGLALIFSGSEWDYHDGFKVTALDRYKKRFEKNVPPVPEEEAPEKEDSESQGVKETKAEASEIPSDGGKYISFLQREIEALTGELQGLENLTKIIKSLKKKNRGIYLERVRDVLLNELLEAEEKEKMLYAHLQFLLHN